MLAASKCIIQAVFLTIDSFMVHDNPRPRNQSQKSKVDWCLETDHSCISIRDKPDAFFQGWKNAFVRQGHSRETHAQMQFRGLD